MPRFRPCVFPIEFDTVSLCFRTNVFNVQKNPRATDFPSRRLECEVKGKYRLRGQNLSFLEGLEIECQERGNREFRIDIEVISQLGGFTTGYSRKDLS